MDPQKMAEMDRILGEEGSARESKFSQMDAVLAQGQRPEESNDPNQLEIPEPSPLSFMQNLIMGFAPDDQTRIRFLQEEFKSAKVDRDSQGNIRINGARINPQGFDLGDVLRNAGYALPVMGQFGAGLLGAAGGTAAAPGVGTVAGAVAAGAAGGAAGEVARQGIGAAMGLRPTGMEAAKSLGRETALAAAGEVTARTAGFALRATKADRAVARLWNKAMKKLGSAGPKVAQFVGGVDPNGTQTAMKHGIEETLSEKYFDQLRTPKTALNTLFGSENVDPAAIGNTSERLFGMQNGTALLAKSIENVREEAYDNFIKQFTGMSDDTIRTIKTQGTKELLSPANLREPRASELAANITKAIDDHDDFLGKAVGRARTAALVEHGEREFVVGDLGENLRQNIQSLGLITPLQTPGGILEPLKRVPGGHEIVDMLNQLGKEVNFVQKGPKGKGRVAGRQFVFFGEKLPTGHTVDKGFVTQAGHLRPLDRRSAVAVEERLGIRANSLFNSKIADPKLKRVASEFLSHYRNRLDEVLGLGNEEKAFGRFRGLVQNLKITRQGATNSLETRIKNFRSQNDTFVQELRDLITQLPERRGERFLSEISLLNAADELKKINSVDVLNRFTGELNNPAILNSRYMGGGEHYLRSIDNHLKIAGNNNPRARTRLFVDDAEKSLAAKEFLKGSPNILRVQAIANMIGAGSGLYTYKQTEDPALSFGVGVAGAGAALAVTSPRNIARLLVAMTKAGKGSFKAPPEVINFLAMGRKTAPALTSQMYRQSVISAEDRAKRQQDPAS